ncbi:ArsR/SmtB family transcription factor [Pararhizobium haloflavum]|uniref:ArsR/SmtB family transcription factor n=1 Tax=Pararhizobium haloflavum TaxID=2037914 RepID=UPI000C17EDFE|nr:metalloregulator ArsR/SmtB family transcription factor [Pararhizobium haloflavum]
MSRDERDDNIFKALASPIRRRICDVLKDDPHTTGALCARFEDFDRCTVMQHLKVLEKADLIIVHRRGRERWNHLNPLPIKAIHDRFIGPHAADAVARLGRLKEELER